ncbi:PH, RCC1 and FYVE domains-containing protein 1 [Tanacetum coccineum]
MELSAKSKKPKLNDVLIWGEGVELGVDALLPKVLDSVSMLDVDKITLAGKHAVLVTKRGEVFCWGEGKSGRGGHNVSCPKEVETLDSVHVKSVSCSEYQTCALAVSGEVYTWGDNCSGQSSRWVPRRISGVLDRITVSKVACGEWHTMIVSDFGLLFTFGDGTFGVLGHRNCQSISEPKQVESLRGMRVKSISCGTWHTVAVLQSMSPRAFMRKQAKAHVDTPTCARQLMYSSTHGTCDIEARDINNSCNATPVLVLHTSHGVKTSPSNDTGDKNRGILGSSSLLMNRVPRWGQVSSPASFRKHGKEESSSNNPSKQKACQQSVEPTVKRKGAKDAIKALTSKLQSMSPRAFMRKQAKAHVNTPTCARQLMYSSTHGTCDIEGSRGIIIRVMPLLSRFAHKFFPASLESMVKEESSSNNPSKQKACQQSVEPTVKRKGAKDAIKALTSKLQSMSPRAFMRKQAKAHVDTPTCARQLMYSSTHGTCDIEARDINNSCNATPVPVLHTSHGVNTSPSDDTGDKNQESSSNNPSKQKACQQSVEPTVKRKGAKDAIKALTSKLQSMSPRAFMRKQAKAHVDTPTCARQLMYSSTHGTCDIEARDINNSCNATPVPLQSMSPRAFMRKQAKAHVDTPTCARQLMYSSTHGTCDIEARDINNSCNATPVPVLHTSHGVNTSPSDDTGDKNRRILGLSSLLMNRVPRWGQLQSMSPRAFIRKQTKAHVDTPTCARQLMYSSTHLTCDIEAKDINNSCNATFVLVLHSSHGVNTSPSDDTWDKNCGISGSSSGVGAWVIGPRG